MVTVVTKTIGTASRDYSTLQAWEDAAPANLVTADQVWRGECYADAEFSAALAVSGSTVDATRYKELTVAAGQSFADHANKMTNALRYNASNGAGLRSTTAWGTALTVGEKYFRLSRLQIYQDSSNGLALTINNQGAVVDGVILEARGGPALYLYSNSTLRNSLLVSRRSGASEVADIWTGCSVANSTFAVPSDLTAATRVIKRSYWSGNTFTNCAFFGGTDAVSSATGATFSNCYTNDSTSIPSGCTTVAYDTSTGSGFENITNGTHDYRIKSTSALIDAGTSTGAPSVDIVGTTRPQGALYDIGPWEYSSGGTTLTVTFIDAAAGLDVASALSAMSATLTDATAAIELITSTATRAASLQEAASAVDLCAAAATMLASLADAAAGSDVQSAALQGNASLLDAATAADIASTMATMAATLTDSATAVDLLAATRIANAAALEAAAAVDQGNSGSTYSTQVLEAASAADALGAAATLVVQLVEAGTVLDQLHAAPDLVTLLTEASAGSDLASAASPQVYSVTALELAAALDVIHAWIEGAASFTAESRARLGGRSLSRLQSRLGSLQQFVSAKRIGPRKL